MNKIEYLLEPRAGERLGFESKRMAETHGERVLFEYEVYKPSVVAHRANELTRAHRVRQGDIRARIVALVFAVIGRDVFASCRCLVKLHFCCCRFCCYLALHYATLSLLFSHMHTNISRLLLVFATSSVLTRSSHTIVITKKQWRNRKKNKKQNKKESQI